MIACNTCHRLLPLRSFRRGWRSNRRLTCRACEQALRRERVRARSQLVSDLKTQPCVDCGLCFPPVCMDFHHVEGKYVEIAHLITWDYSLNTIRREIAKCVLLCACCHRLRSVPMRPPQLSDPPTLSSKPLTTLQKRRFSRRRLVAALKTEPCSDCGRSYPAPAMDFHHQYGKRYNVATLAEVGFAEKTIAAEIAKCILLCANCHRLHTAGDRKCGGQDR